MMAGWTRIRPLPDINSDNRKNANAPDHPDRPQRSLLKKGPRGARPGPSATMWNELLRTPTAEVAALIPSQLVFWVAIPSSGSAIDDEARGRDVVHSPNRARLVRRGQRMRT